MAFTLTVFAIGLALRSHLTARHAGFSLTQRAPAAALVSTASAAASVPALATAAASRTATISPQQRSLEERFGAFPRTWVPIASTFELEPDRPTPVKFLSQDYVAFRDNRGEWRVMDDACPHRLAPLSEGRIDRESDRIECAYHGWSFEPSGACARIPQASESVAAGAVPSRRACVASYPTREHKSVLWVWPWEEDCLTVAGDLRAQPEGFLRGVAHDASTYTRDLPYGWDTLLENIVDPAHIPFAHHGLQGKRDDAIAINMTSPIPIHAADAADADADGGGGGGGGGGDAASGVRGFWFDFGDRTMGKRRAGVGAFRAPFVVAYNADYEAQYDKKGRPRPSRPFNLTVVCVPTSAGRSRAIIFGGSQPETKEARRARRRQQATEGAEAAEAADKKPPSSPASLLFKLLPVWLGHLFSNRFLDSDLAFLHYQEQVVRTRGGEAAGSYFMPTQSDRCIAALRRWLSSHAPSGLPASSASGPHAGLGPLPPPIYSRDALFDHFTQHTSHCRHCQAAVSALAAWRKRTYRVLAAALLLGVRFWLARLVGVACLGLLRLYVVVEKQFQVGEYKHWQNH